MRISSSTISMGATRNYTAEATEEQTTIIRHYSGDTVTNASARTVSTNISQFEVEGGLAVYTTSESGVIRTELGQQEYANTESRPQKGKEEDSITPIVVSAPGNDNWLSQFTVDENDFLVQMLRMLEKFTGKKFRWNGLELPAKMNRTAATGFQASASMASMRYKQTVAMAGVNAGVKEAAGQSSQGGALNGVWTRQTVTSGFIEGQEHTAFASRGTAVTADGRIIDFGITVEMSRSFEAAYEVVGKEEIYTDPLIINLDTNTASLSDVSFYFDLNCDGTAEEISALENGSGFLALDKNGDGEINDGSELFGARTGDGFGELAEYDQDGNGWIDENDDIFSKLTVWVKCGSGEAEQLSLSKANIGAIFLGSQNTQHSLVDSYGNTGAMIRKTGIYLKESGQVGTIQHVDFKA